LIKKFKGNDIEDRKTQHKKLHKAKINKKDEFYTQLSDIENELKHYIKHFKGKVVFCNCDDPDTSEFWNYFYLKFKVLGLKKLISTHYNYDGMPTYKLEYNGIEKIRTDLMGDGDFRSFECIELLKEADIIVTNPPFSLFREYVAQLVEYNKSFIIIGHQNALTYKDIFKLIKENKMWLGYGFTGGAAHFINKYYKDYATANNHKDGMIRVSGVAWFTNLEIKKRYENLLLYKKFNEKDYSKYDNYSAINVGITKDIPVDYDGEMGVPITFMYKYNPEQFEIIALGIIGSINFTSNKKMEILDRNGNSTGKFTKNAKGTLYKLYDPLKDKKPSFRDVQTGVLYSSIYARIIIKNKKFTGVEL
jgi:hypothetical protein